jgi:predicted phosphoadenosine phosphosulfate sulfurtransferase
MPIKLFNATSTEEQWLKCWDPEAEDRWMRPRVPYAYTENKYGTDRFNALFGAIVAKEFPTTPTCYLAGVRTEESPTRFIGLTSTRTYKWITWGAQLNTKLSHYTLYPIYDWSYTDVWAAIHKNGWEYCSIYDAYYNYGVPTRNMRVSNVHHETAVNSLFHLQEIEPETYVKLTQRLKGVDMAGKMGKADYFPKELPFMFASWAEYRDYLVDKLIDPEWQDKFKDKFAKDEEMYGDTPVASAMYGVHVASVLTNDWEFIKIKNWEATGEPYGIRRKKRGLAAWSNLDPKKVKKPKKSQS